MPRALLSVSDKTGITEFARGLAARGFEAGVDRRHRACAVGGRPRRSSASPTLTGFPEMMDGRVKTLHPAIHGGILARRDRADDLAALARPRHRPRRSRRRQPVSVCRRRGQSRHAVRRAGRGNRHRRAVARSRRRQELPRRARGRSIRPTTRACSRRSTRRRASHSGSISCARPSRTPPPTTPRLPRRCATITAEWRHVRARGRGRPRRRSPSAWTCRSRRFATCATARTRTSARPGIRAGVSRCRSVRLQPDDDPPGQGTVVHEPARPRRRGANRARVRRARGRRRQAHESVRGGDWQLRGRRVRARARRGRAVGVRRHRRPEPADRSSRPPRPSRPRASTPSSPRRWTTRRAPSWRARPTMRVVIADFGGG